MKIGNQVQFAGKGLMIGSMAFYLGREPKDYDIIIDKQSANKFISELGDRVISSKQTRWGMTYFINGMMPVEFEYTDCTQTGYELVCLAEYYPIKDIIYAVKMSHRYLRNSPHFNKTMNDIHYLRRLGASMDSLLQDWCKRREKETLDYSHPSLKKNKKDFFSNDGINYIYDHDDIHKAVAIGTRPAYLEYACDDSEVLSSKLKFDAQSYRVKLNGVIEESCVLALERMIIPNNIKSITYGLSYSASNNTIISEFSKDIDRAFDIALKKVCSSITSGWFREFAWENYHNARYIYYRQHRDYVDKFISNLRKGKVKEHVS